MTSFRALQTDDFLWLADKRFKAATADDGARIRERKRTASLNKPNICHRRFTARRREEKKKVEGSGIEWREKPTHAAESFHSSSCVFILIQTAPHVLFQNKTLTYIFFLHIFLLTFARFYRRKTAFCVYISK